jgi:hypothetical protein
MQMPRFGMRSSGAALRIPRLGQGADTCPIAGPRPVWPGHARRHHLGQGTNLPSTVVSTAGSAATAGLTAASVIGVSASAAKAISTAIPLIGVGVAVVLILLKFLGKGCGAACTVTAQLHQIVDAVGLNIQRVAQAGLISGPEAQTALQSFINTGDQIEEQASQYPKEVASSIKQFTADLVSWAAAAADLPATPSQPWSLSAARALYVGHGTGSGDLAACGPGTWYCASISQADTLTDQILQTIVSNRSTAAAAPETSGVVSSLESEAASVGLTSPTGGLTEMGYLAIAALAVGGFFLLRGSGRPN